jgi:hypothetical protein
MVEPAVDVDPDAAHRDRTANETERAVSVGQRDGGTFKRSMFETPTAATPRR